MKIEHLDWIQIQISSYSYAEVPGGCVLQYTDWSGIAMCFIPEPAKAVSENIEHDAPKTENEPHSPHSPFIPLVLEDGMSFQDKQKKKQEFALSNPHTKIHIIFHGGCHGCKTPLRAGIGICVKCHYFNSQWEELPSLYTD